MRQRNNSQSNGKEESHKKALNDIEASKLSDIELKTMVIRKFNDLSENYKNYREATRNLLRTTPA